MEEFKPLAQNVGTRQQRLTLGLVAHQDHAQARVGLDGLDGAGDDRAGAHDRRPSRSSAICIYFSSSFSTTTASRPCTFDQPQFQQTAWGRMAWPQRLQ